MIKYDTFRKGGKVSVWIGNLSTDMELDDYMNIERDFETDFGFALDGHDMPETKVEEKPVPISNLVDGFSWADSYAEAVSQLAKKQGIESASTMVVCINFEYKPEQARLTSRSRLIFLGVVNFESKT